MRFGLIRGSAALATIAIAVFVAGRHVWRLARRSAQVAELATPTADSPNVLLVILDTVRDANLSLYGYAKPTTPQLIRRAAEAMVEAADHCAGFGDCGGLERANIETEWAAMLDAVYPPFDIPASKRDD